MPLTKLPTYNEVCARIFGKDPQGQAQDEQEEDHRTVARAGLRTLKNGPRSICSCG
jgi:hypothetical protein